ncbi:MAG: DedA family protein [Patescibacteria group bacterium]
MEQGTNFFLPILAKFGWLGNWLFLFIALVECIPFIGAVFPGGTLVTIGGFLAAQGYFNVWKIMAFATVGAIIGDYFGYSLGRWGSEWLKNKKIIKPELIAKGTDFFEKYGNKSIFWGRFFGATRAVIPFIAGASRMKQRPFLFWNVSGAIFWSATSIALGYFSGNIIAAVIKKWSHKLGLVLIIGAAIFLIYWAIKRHGQSLWDYFRKKSDLFTANLFKNRRVANLDNRYPVISEFFLTAATREKIFGGFLGAIILIILYILALFLNWL